MSLSYVTTTHLPYARRLENDITTTASGAMHQLRHNAQPYEVTADDVAMVADGSLDPRKMEV